MSTDEHNLREPNEREPKHGAPDPAMTDRAQPQHTPDHAADAGEQGQFLGSEGVAGRPKFDDVASLFGNIVPPAGTPVRSRTITHRLPTLAEPSGPAILVSPPHRTTPDFGRLGAKPEPRPGPVADPAMAQSFVADPVLPKVERTDPRPLPPQFESRSEPQRRASSQASGNIPWPDAFEPTRNYRRKPASQYWAWLLLVPLLAVAAIGVFMVDPQTIRGFVDTHFPHLQHPATETVTSLLPAPFRTDTPSTTPTAPSTPAAPSAANPGPSTTPPANPTPTPSGGSTETAPDPAAPSAATAEPPAAPELRPVPPTVTPSAPFVANPAANPLAASPSASPMATNPTAGSTVTDPAPASAPAATPSVVAPPASTAPDPVEVPAAQASAGASQGIAHIIVHYRRAAPAGEAEARRIVTQAERMAGTVDLRLGSSNYRSPTVVYYTPLDRDAATGLARSLGEGWSVRAGPGRATQGTMDLWLP